jgi:hypothetical protein
MWKVLACFVVLTSACASSAGATNHSGSDDPCKDVDVAVEKVWSASIKAEVLSYKGGGSVEERESVANKMDAVSEDWVRLRRSVCRDHLVRKLIDADTYRAQVKCFDDRLDQQRQLVTLLKAGNTSDASKLATALEVPHACK